VKNTDDVQFSEHSRTFKHLDFHRDSQEALENIKRKVSSPNIPMREEAGMRLAMKMTGWIPVSYPAHVPARTFLPRPKGINGVFLSVAGIGSCGFHARDEKARYRYGPRFWLGVVVWVEETQYPRWRIDMYWSAAHCVRGILH